MQVPTIHLNGTSRDALLEQLCNAIDAVHAAGSALAQACPNGRDYYPQGGDAMRLAMNAHVSRMRKLHEVATELEEIANAI